MSSQDLPLEFFELVQAVNLGQATPVQIKELEHQLLSDAHARELYYEIVDIDQGLAELAAESQARAPFQPLRRDDLEEDVVPAVSLPRRDRRVYLRDNPITVALLSLLVGLGIWGLMGPVRNQPPFQQRIAVSAPSPRYVATLTRATDCEWEEEAFPYFEGKRLLTSDLRLTHGVVEFRLETGVRLVLEGPTRLRLDSAQAAELTYGKVVLHGHEFAEGFRLKTPQSTLTDIGTEYGVSVGRDESVELHVFDGLVESQPKSDQQDAEVIRAGKAIRYTDDIKEMVPLRPDLFQREVPGHAENSRVSRDGLLSFEGFRSPKDEQNSFRWQNGGMGWIGPWTGELGSKALCRALVDPTLKLHPRTKNQPRTTGALTLDKECRFAWRELQHPIRLDTDGLYYICFYLQKLEQAAASTTQYGSLSLRTGTLPRDSKRIGFGMSSERLPILLHNEQKLQIAPPLNVGESYLYVAKIVAGATSPDEVRMRVFSLNEQIPQQEPHVWTCISTPAYDDTVYTHLTMYVEGVRYAFDELRIATSWDAVINFDWPRDRDLLAVEPSKENSSSDSSSTPASE